MRAFRYSPHHGDVHSLNQYTSPGPKQGPWLAAIFARESLCLPVDGHLLLRHRWSRGLPCPYGWDQCLYDADQLCPHIRSSGTNKLEFHVRFKMMLNAADKFSAQYASEFNKGMKFDRGIVYTAFRCSAYSTELVVGDLPSRVQRGPMANLIRRCPRVLTITRYIDIGPCMTPEDEEWKALTRIDEKQLEDFTARRPIAERLGEQHAMHPHVHTGDTAILPDA
jgi:hypothetical protein